MNFCVINLGCKVNRVESDAIVEQLLRMGMKPSQLGEARIVVINTCTVTGEAEKKTRKAVHHALRSTSAETEIIVTGCAAAISPEVFCAMSSRVSVLGKADIEQYLSRTYPSKSADATTTLFNSHERVGVKIQDGCNHACTYCIVHVARGGSRSLPAASVVARCASLAKAGVPEIVLTGINLGNYSDPSKASNGQAYLLENLLCDIVHATEPAAGTTGYACRIRISSVEPTEVSNSLISCLKEHHNRICWHLHLPLQSGSNKVLQEMGRPYSADVFEELVAKLYRELPTLSLSTDIIVGFPGETDEDFQASCELATRCRFSKIHVFPYSRRQGTPAAARTDQVPPEVSKARAKHLRMLAAQLRNEQLQMRKGQKEWAVVEEGGLATTESYFSVTAPAGAAQGSLVLLTL